MVKTLQTALRPLLAALTCALIAACAQNPPRQADLDYRTDPAAMPQAPNSTPDASGQRLTIKSGQGERLNLPWFIRDAQDWVNNY
jgi:uncharacterized lipoprotein